MPVYNDTKGCDAVRITGERLGGRVRVGGGASECCRSPTEPKPHEALGWLALPLFGSHCEETSGTLAPVHG